MRKYLALVLLLLAWACKNPLDDFALSFKIPLSDGLHTFTLRQYGAGLLPKEAFTLKTYGSSKDLLVNHLGNPTLEPNEEGKMVIGIPQDYDFTTKKNFVFNLKIGSKGFTSKYYNFTKADRGNYNATTYLASKTKTLAGIWGDSLSISNNVAVLKELKNENNETLATLSLAANTNWKAVSYPLEMNMVHFKTRNYLPGGGTVGSYYDTKGVLQNSPFEIKDFAAMLYLQAADGQGQISISTDKTFGLTFDLSKTIDPLTGMLWSVNDSLDVINYQEETNRWYKLARAKPNNKREVKINVSQTGHWILARTSSLCNTGPEFKINSAYQGIDIFYLYRVEDSQSKVLRSGYLSVNNGSVVRLNYFPETTGSVRLVVYDFNNFYGGNANLPIATTNWVSSCSFSNTPIALKLTTTPQPVEVELKLVCPAGKTIGPDLLKTQIRTQISEPGKNQWTDLLVFTFENPKITTYKIRKGGVYDFRISTDGGNTWPFLQSGFKIKEQKWSLDVNAEGYCK
ncbi:MAG: hypothetical protein CFE21_22015 [Bacteroidetes bacterium B1(2017)]|nr:MAG: hypothetical protein CFE21_22015 [Bacteroidetes bacterium B1(2017)]